MLRRLLPAVLALAVAAALPSAASARTCTGSAQTSQPDGGQRARKFRAYHTTCRVAKSVARHWDGVAGHRPKDAKGRRWTYRKGVLLSRGIRNIFTRPGMRISFVTDGSR